MKTTGIIFDLDGTLLDSMDVWAEVDAYLVEKTGVVLTPEDDAYIASASLPEACEYFHSVLGAPQTPTEIQTIIDDFVMRFYCNASLRPGAAELVHAVREAGIPCCVVSSSSRPYIVAGLKSTGLLDCFCAVLSADDFDTTKRERFIFDKACEIMGSEPATTWGIDDAAYALKVLKDAGYRTLAAYDPGSSPWEEVEAIAEYAVRDLRDVDFDRILDR